MEKIKYFTRETVKELRPELQAVLDMLYDDYGVKFEIGSITFKSNQFTTRLTARCGNPEDLEKTPYDRKLEKAEKNFQSFAFMHGFESTDLGKQFTSQGHSFTIIGLKTGKTVKYPILARRTDGQIFKFTAGLVKRALGDSKIV